MLIKIIDCRKGTLNGVEIHLFTFGVETPNSIKEHLVAIKTMDLTSTYDLAEARVKAIASLKASYAAGNPTDHPTLTEALGVVVFE